MLLNKETKPNQTKPNQGKLTLALNNTARVDMPKNQPANKSFRQPTSKKSRCIIDDFKAKTTWNVDNK